MSNVLAKMKKLLGILLCSSAVMFGAASSSDVGLLDDPDGMHLHIILKKVTLAEGALTIYTSPIAIELSCHRPEGRGFAMRSWTTGERGKEISNALGIVAQGPLAMFCCEALATGYIEKLRVSSGANATDALLDVIVDLNTRYPKESHPDFKSLSFVATILVCNQKLFTATNRTAGDEPKVFPQLILTLRGSAREGSTEFADGDGMPTLSWEPKE